jgi:hypothetical protein
MTGKREKRSSLLGRFYGDGIISAGEICGDNAIKESS